MHDASFADSLSRLNRRRDAERGFSLIELIIVIVILGILVAIAIPVYNNIQDNARDSALKTAAANGASQAVASIANGTAVTAGQELTNLESGKVKYVAVSKGTTADTVCVVASDATGTTGNKFFAGPGATADNSACK